MTREQRHTYYMLHRDKILAKHAAYYATHKEQARIIGKLYLMGHKKHHDAVMHEYKKAHRSVLAVQETGRRLGLTISQVMKMRISAEGRCQICGNIPKHTLFIDHNHRTGQVRGVVCRRCNVRIGYIEKDPELTRKTYEYLALFSKGA